jgi:tetratricopeptide (TPR) repeat protein
MLFWACTTKKDVFATRAYHNTTAHFNGFFNASESVRKGLDKIKLAYKEDYDVIIPVFVEGDTALARQAYPEMERAIEKCEKVISKHTIVKEANKPKEHPKYNKWIDDNYMVLGRAHFYKGNYFKSQELFLYVNKKYKDPETQLYSETWAARTAVEREDYTKALQLLNRLEPDDKMRKAVVAEYYLVFTDYYLRQKKYKQAAEKMEKAIEFTRKKSDRARLHFILAQIYAALENSNDAMREFEAVLHSRPTYELEFYAKINKALSFSRRGGSFEDIRKQLEKMLKDEKNKEYKDRIYYALGDVYLEEQKRAEAIGMFEKSLRETPAANKKQKAKTFLTLADLYFDQRKYASAQHYYDSTLSNINKDFARYTEVKARAESLGELVGYLDIIENNDSIVSICNLSEEEQEKKIASIQKKMEEEMAEQKRQDEEAAANAATNTAGPDVTGTFWAYNTSLRSKGYEYFKDYWGDRPLKDNWRLSSKLSMSFGTADESIVVDTLQKDTTAVDEDKYKVPDIAELKASLPCGDANKMANATASVSEAYYQSGLIYKEKLNDDDNGIYSWEQLVANVDSSSYHPVAYYQLFRTWYDKEQTPGFKSNPFCSTCSSSYWADIIREKYPGSEWLKLVDNPKFMENAEARQSEDELQYESTYRLYTSRRYREAIDTCSRIINYDTSNTLICKFRLLRAVCVGYTDASMGMREAYLSELQQVKSNCSGTEEAKRADELLKAARKDQVPGPGKDEKLPPPNLPLDNRQSQKDSLGDKLPLPPAGESPYKLDLTGEHYFAMLFPLQGTNINAFKNAVIDYNTQNFASADLKTSNNLLGQAYHIVLVKTFKKLDEGKNYIGAFRADQGLLKDVNEAKPIIFLISKPNYITLFKTKDVEGYLGFYQANYSN